VLHVQELLVLPSQHITFPDEHPQIPPCHEQQLEEIASGELLHDSVFDWFGVVVGAASDA
jgi:hypothetical protein